MCLDIDLIEETYNDSGRMPTDLAAFKIVIPQDKQH